MGGFLKNPTGGAKKFADNTLGSIADIGKYGLNANVNNPLSAIGIGNKTYGLGEVAAGAGLGYLAAPYLTGAAGGTAGTAATNAGVADIVGMTGPGSIAATGTAAGTGVGGMAGALGSGMGVNSLSSLLKGNAGQLLSGAAGMYNANQQGQAAQDISNQQMSLQKPYYDAGTQALGRMSQGVNAYQADPYNQFLQDQGNQAINRNAAARGMLGSGNLLAELAKYGQGMAGKGYQDWFGNQATIAGYGSPAAANMGNAYATGKQGGADATSGMLSAGANMFNNIYNNPEASWNTQNTGISNTQYPGQTPPFNPYATDFSQWLPKSV